MKALASAGTGSVRAVVTEAMDGRGAELVAEYADCMQIGARNMQNYSLLKFCGTLGKPVLLKRGLAATINDLLLSAEYLLSIGNKDGFLCQSGVTPSLPATPRVRCPLNYGRTPFPCFSSPSDFGPWHAKACGHSWQASSSDCFLLSLTVTSEPVRPFSVFSCSPSSTGRCVAIESASCVHRAFQTRD